MNRQCTNEERADAKIDEMEATMRNIEKLLQDPDAESHVERCRKQVDTAIRNLWLGIAFTVFAGTVAVAIIMYHVIGDIVRFETHESRISAIEREQVRLHPNQYPHGVKE